MSEIKLKLIDQNNINLLKQNSNSITDFALDTANGELIDSGILLDDLGVCGTFKSYQPNTNKIISSIPDIKNRYVGGRNLENNDTFIKPIIELENDNKDNPEFWFIQKRLSAGYNTMLDKALEKNLLMIDKKISLYHKNNLYEIIYYNYKGFIVAKVPNTMLNFTDEKGHTWYLLSKIKGKVVCINEISYFIPDKILYSGVSYRKANSLINDSFPQAIREKKRK